MVMSCIRFVLPRCFALTLLLTPRATVAASESLPPGFEIQPIASTGADPAMLRALMPGLSVTPRITENGLMDATSRRTLSTLASASAWTELPPPARWNAVGVYDSIADRLVICGLTRDLPGDDIWSLEVDPPTGWTRLGAQGAFPEQDEIAATVVDHQLGRVYFIGSGNERRIGEVYALDLFDTPRWTRLSSPSHVSDAPQGRAEATAVLDRHGNRLVMFGGRSRELLNDTWAFDLMTGGWSRIDVVGDTIPPRSSPTSVLDSQRNRLLVYGGLIETQPRWLDATDELWALDLGESPSWERVITQGDTTGIRFGSTLIRDPREGGFFLVGGPNDGKIFRLRGNPSPAWVEVQPSGAPSRARPGDAWAFDSRRDQYYFFAGLPSDRINVDRLSMRPAPSWQVQLGEPLPPSRFGHAMAIDSKRDRLTIFGGVSEPGYLGDTWTASLEDPNGWIRLEASNPPPPRHEPVMVYDPIHDRMLMFGGWTYPESYFDDLWILTLDPMPTWSSVQLSGTSPQGRRGHAAVYDPLRQRVLVFFGLGSTGALGDIWALHLEGEMYWERLDPSGSGPRARYFSSVIHDPTRDRVVLYGGAADAQSIGDAWGLSLDDLRWELLTSGYQTPAFARHTAVYDADHDRMVAFGGFVVDYDLLMHYSGVTFNLEFSDGPRWTREHFGNIAGARIGHTATYDATRSRMCMFGGSHLLSHRNDTWLLDFSGGPRQAWLLGATTAGQEVTLAWQTRADAPSSVEVERSSIHESWRVVGRAVLGAHDRFFFRDHGLKAGWPYRYRLRGAEGLLSGESSVTTSGAPSLQVLGAWPNPAPASKLEIRFALATADPVTVEILDLAGRRVLDERFTPHVAGVARLAPNIDVRAGIYVVRVTQSGRSAVGKICVLP